MNANRLYCLVAEAGPDGFYPSQETKLVHSTLLLQRY